MTRWTVLPPYLVRMAGFAFARLEPLRCTGAVAAAEALDEATAARRAAGRALDEAVASSRYADDPAFDDPAVRKALSKHVKRLRAFARELGEVLPEDALHEVVRALPAVAGPAAALADVHGRWRTAEQAYGDAFATGFERAREALRAMYAGDPRLQEAVFLESPEAFARIQQLIDTGGPRNARARQRERLAALYAQRFCAKNETNSICGPHGAADASEPGTGAAIDVITEDARRATYVSHWAAQRLLDEAVRRAGDAAPVTLRIHPSARVDGTALAWCAMEHDATTSFRRRWGKTEVPEAGAQLLRELAEPRTLAALIARGAELELEPDDVTGFVDQLAEAGVVVRGPVVPTGLFQPLRWVAGELESWPASDARTWALGELAALEELVAGFAAAPLARRIELGRELAARFVAATGEAATRGEGQHYADRSLVHEDCAVAVRASLGPLRGTLDRALPVLIEVLGLPLELARERVREWFRARFGDARVPVLEVHRAYDEDRVLDTPATTPRAEALRAAIERVRTAIGDAVDGSGGGPVRLDSGALADALAGTSRSIEAGYVSADVMIRATPEGAELVLGEVHGFIWLPTCLLDVLPERDRVVDAMRGALREMAAGRRTAECVFLHTQATDRRFAIADADLQMLGTTERAGAIDFGALELRLAGDTFEYTLDGAEVVPLVAYARYPFVLYTSRIAPLFDDFAERFFPDSLLPGPLRDADAPRLAVDELVFRRRSWRRPAAEVKALLDAPTEAELLRRGRALRRSLGCPERVFVSLATEPKPILLDFANVFLLEALVNQLERQPEGAVVKLGEMLPAPDELVTRAPDGLRTSELRMGFYTR